MDCRHRDFSGRRAVFVESRAGLGDGCPNVWSHRVGVPKVVIPAVGGGSSDLGSCVSRALRNHRSPELEICRPSEPRSSERLQTFGTTDLQSRRSADLRNHRSPELEICRPSEPQVLRAGDLQTFGTTDLQSRRSADLRNHRSPELEICRPSEPRVSHFPPSLGDRLPERRAGNRDV